MSQSDYLKYKRISTELKINKLSNVFSPSDYVGYKEYSLENTIYNTKIRYNQLKPSNKTIVFNMEKTKNSDCPTFITCKNTNTRPNRTTYSSTYKSQYATVRPIRPFTQKQLDISLNETNLCLCSNL